VKTSKSKRLKWLLPVAAFTALLWCSSAAAAIYVCRSSDGGTHFTNMPMSENCVIFKKKRTSSFSLSGSDRGSYEAYIRRFGSRYRVDPNLIKAVIRTESDFNQYAVSRKGAQGLIQLMPETAKEMNVADPFHPGQNIEGGTRYLRFLLDTFDQDLILTLAAYNAGPTIVRKVRRIPRIPETQAYVKRVLAHYKRYSGRGEVADILRGSRIKVSDIVTVQ
jgi:hypothetical protein